MNRKNLGILGAVTLLVLLGALVVTRQESPHSLQHGRLVFPDLRQSLNAIRKVTIESKERTVTLSQGETAWAVEEKHGYPADMGQVRSLLIGLAELRVMEPKTKNPELYGKLGLNDVKAENHAATLVSLHNTEGQQQASILIGDTRPAKGDPAKEEMYVRLPNEPQALQVRGRLKLKQSAEEWMDRQLVDIKTDRVRSLRILHPDGEIVSLTKDKPQSTDMVLQNMKKGTTVQSQFTLNNMVDTLAHLTLADVRPADKDPFQSNGALKAIVETFDGLRLTATTKKDNGQHLATLVAEFDENLIETVTSQNISSNNSELKNEGQKEEIQPSSEAKPSVTQTQKLPDEVKREVDTLNTHFQKWMFVLPEFRVTAISKRQQDLTKPVKPPQQS